MLQKTQEKKKAIILRKQGYSLNEISAKLGVSKSSASLWVGRLPLSITAQAVIEHKKDFARQKSSATIRRRTDTKIKAAREYGKSVVIKTRFSQNGLRILCALLYWCEGVKIRRKGVFGFTNSDPFLVSTFMRLLRENFPIQEGKLRITVHVHEYHDIDKQLRFWSKVTNIPLAQCHKPYLKPHTTIRKREGYQGCVSVRYMDVEFARRIEGIAMAFLEEYGPIG